MIPPLSAATVATTPTPMTIQHPTFVSCVRRLGGGKSMPRSDPARQKRYVRAYHRASAELRKRHLTEWEELRQHFLSDEHDLTRNVSPGPKRGWRAVSVDNVMRDLREALDEVWGLLPKKQIDQLDAATAELCRTNHDELWHAEDEACQPSRPV